MSLIHGTQQRMWHIYATHSPVGRWRGIPNCCCEPPSGITEGFIGFGSILAHTFSVTCHTPLLRYVQVYIDLRRHLVLLICYYS